jgi:hypothetical protein
MNNSAVSKMDRERGKLRLAVVFGTIATLLMIWFIYKGADFVVSLLFALFFLGATVGAAVLLTRRRNSV